MKLLRESQLTIIVYGKQKSRSPDQILHQTERFYLFGAKVKNVSARKGVLPPPPLCYVCPGFCCFVVSV